MKIKILTNHVDQKNCKASISAYGVLKFNVDSKEFLKLSDGKEYLLGVDESDNQFSKFILVEPKSPNVASIKVSKSGEGFGLHIADFCGRLNIDYKEKLYAFAVQKSDEKYHKMQCYTLTLESTKPRTNYKGKGSTEPANA